MFWDKVQITSDYGDRILQGEHQRHPGIDLRSWNSDFTKRLDLTLPLEAVFLWEAHETTWGYTYAFMPTSGPADEIRFTHVTKNNEVKPGRTYSEGFLVGHSALTEYMEKNGFGEHLHFSTRKNGKIFDPKQFFDAIGVKYENAK